MSLMPADIDPTLAASYLRDLGYKVTAPDEDHEFHVRQHAPGPSHQVVGAMKPNTLGVRIVEFLDAQGAHGATDDEMEMWSGLTHQSVSAARNSLMHKGLIRDSTTRRETRSGNMAIVWVRTLVQPTSYARARERAKRHGS